MSRNLVRPFFPIPPTEYRQDYFSEILRSFSSYLVQMQNPGEGRHTALVLTGLQTDDFNLEPGTVFQHEGVLRIPLENTPYVRGSSATGSAGQVTVTVT